MMIAGKPPEAWYWSHDIESNQIGSIVAPGMHLMRLSSYGTGNHRRFAALVFKDSGPDHSYVLDLDAPSIEALLREADTRPIAITVDVSGSQRRFSLVLQKEPAVLSSVHLDLDEAGARRLLDDRHCISDFVTYAVDGARKYAVILEERSGSSWFLTNVTARELDSRLTELGASLRRVRTYVEEGQPRFAAVAEQLGSGKWAWYAGLEADAVASKLDANDAYPFDLDATRDEHGVRFTVVMYRNKP
ncbi:hypothetical protein EBAPG3_013485 [Nitrosospira lacus]|uniref:Uncharacterized protein n=1 Tax=Nitrosospira lacus TaxID=1288494 RepID=A0A1W6SSC6_9PROT|nr:hypothetical protein [Nitrosospira lacus]ARO88696.1 hypothetical protein EBAPG3_013485 [Nitrosospira lacus]